MNLMWENIFKNSKGSKNISTLLSHNVIFEGLTHREIRFVESLVHVRNYRAGEYVFRQGEVGVGMYLLMTGNVDITLETLEPKNNKPIYVTRLESGDFFGEIALIEDNGRRTANAIAFNECSLLGFFKPDLNELIERNPVTGIKVVTKLAQVLGTRLRETSLKVTELKLELQKV